MRTMFCLSTLALVGCGAQETPQTTSSLVPLRAASIPTMVDGRTISLAVASPEFLPTCASEIEGQLVYSIETREFFVCRSAAWEPVDVRGERGIAGERGEQGIQGESIVGPQGERGERGEVGIQGDQGVAGSQGVAGQDGLSTGIRIWAATSECPAGGSLLQAFADLNRNGSWEEGEATYGSPTPVCNGLQGEQGLAGANGMDGTNGTDASTKITTTFRCQASVTTAGLISRAHDLIIKSFNLDFRVWRAANGDVSIQGSLWWLWQDGIVSIGPTTQTTNYKQPGDTRVPMNARSDGPTVFMPAHEGALTYGWIMNIYTGTSEGSWQVTLDESASTATLRLLDSDSSPASINGNWSNIACTKTAY